MYIVKALSAAKAPDYPGSDIEWKAGESRIVHDSLIERYKGNPNWVVSGGPGTSPVTAETNLTGGVNFSSGGANLSIGNGNTIVLFGDSETELNQYIGAFSASALTQSGGVATLTGLASFNGQLVRVSRTGSTGFSDGYNGEKRLTVSGGTAHYSVDPTLVSPSIQQSPFTTFIAQYKSVASDKGWFHYANARLKQALFLKSVSAIGGFRTSHLLQMINDPVFGVFPYTPKFCTLFIGINDIINSVPAADVITNLESTVNQITNRGIQCFFFTIMPLASPHASYNNSTVEKAIFTVNRYIREKCRITPGLYLVDAFAAIVNPLTTPLSAQAGYLSPTDGIHLTPLGGRILGDAFFDVAVRLNLPPCVQTCSHVSDNYGADAANVQLITNPLMTGTAGTLTVGTSSTFTGTVATSWTSQWNGNAAGGCVHTQPARTVAVDGDAIGNNQQLAITFAANGDYVDFRQTTQFNSRIAAGDDIVMEAHVSWTGCTNFDGLHMLAALADGVSTLNSANWGYHSADGGWSQADFSGVVRTPPLRVPSGVTGAQARFYIGGSGAGGVTVKIGRVTLRKANSGDFGA